LILDRIEHFDLARPDLHQHLQAKLVNQFNFLLLDQLKTPLVIRALVVSLGLPLATLVEV
jgi:hypothetical protein